MGLHSQLNQLCYENNTGKKVMTIVQLIETMAQNCAKQRKHMHQMNSQYPILINLTPAT